MAGNKDLCWVWSAARGHSGGMAVVVKSKTFEIEESILSTYNMWLLVRNRVTKFRFWCANVYGPAQHEVYEDFIKEISKFCDKENLFILMGGDFNLIRNNRERNHGQGDPRLMEMFNSFIGRF